MEKQITISESEYDSLKKKADKWDALRVQIDKCYGEKPDNSDAEIPGADLGTIGEFAAHAYGYL